MSCCGGNCGCGADCKCGSGCKGCKMYPDMSYAEETTPSETLVLGIASQKSNFGGSEFGMGPEFFENGCECNTCGCNPCTANEDIVF